PPDLNYDHNEASSGDDITLLAIAQFWPPRTWGSLYERADYQADRLARLARGDDHFYMIRTRSDLEAALAAREVNPDVVAGIMGMEGAHPFEGDLENVGRLYDAGHRLVGLQHFFDNELGGSLHGADCEGLTAFGADVVREADRRSIVIDIAHSCEQVAWDVLDLTARPVIVSHTGIRSKCDTARNVSDDLLAAVARKGGLIGIGFWDDAICDATPDGIASMIIHGVETFGVDAIALGSDFDGTVPTYIDVSQLAAITDALMRAGMSDTDIRKVMGENQIRFFLEQLPQGS
ncbi:MAG: membrane dipeptidase, partial [Pseudomonadota bacterium]